MDRAKIRELIGLLSSYNVWTSYRVEGGKLHVTVPGGLLDDQREKIIPKRDDLIQFLTTPPDLVGICRRGHRVRWVCTKYGVWICQCYFEEQEKWRTLNV